jgi:hypothetical protein
MRYLILVSAVVLSYPGYSNAGIITRACMSSDRDAASPFLCSCIQTVANDMLSRRDQRRAAKFFADPDRAQEMRQSSRSSHEAFWLRYKAFGERAETYCAS